MFRKIAYKVMARVFERGFKHIEKMDWMTKTLEVAFKNKFLNATWGSFLNNVVMMLEDAIEEVQQARSWKK